MCEQRAGEKKTSEKDRKKKELRGWRGHDRESIEILHSPKSQCLQAAQLLSHWIQEASEGETTIIVPGTKHEKKPPI